MGWGPRAAQQQKARTFLFPRPETIGTVDIMTTEPLRYDRMVETALRGVVRDAMREVVERGMPGEHHFYITYRTDHPGVEIPANLKAQYPDEITIVLQYQFHGLAVDEAGFEVTLSFGGRHEHLRVPFNAISAFIDPSVNFALQFQPIEEEGEERVKSGPSRPMPFKSREEDADDDATPDATEEKPAKMGEVVTLDAFRKK